MKKKTIALMGFSVLAGLVLVGCGKKDDNKKTTTSADGGDTTTTSQEYSQDTKGLDVSVNYNGSEGITLLVDSYNNAAESKTYKKGDLLPTWAAFAKNTKTTIRDAADYTKTSNDDDYDNIKTNDWKNPNKTSEKVDLFYNSTGNIKKMANNGQIQDLSTYINSGKMPYFKDWLDHNQTIGDAIKINGKYYYTPYFDGYNYIERQLVIDTTLAFKVLDQNSFDNFDTATAGKGANANQLQENEYEPFVYEMNGETKVNYAGETKQIDVSKGGQKTTITVKGNVENIISQQNKLLSATGGTTGKALAEQLRAYLTAVYGDNIGSDKTYVNYTEIFAGESAAYTTDELIALMRVIKANPGVITGSFDSNGQLIASGSTTAEIELLIPRGAENSRVQNVLMFAEVWGVQGLDGEKDNLYIDSNGMISDARATKQTYEALQYLHQIYDEGLIVGDFYEPQSGSRDKNYYVEKYIGKEKNEGGYAFIMHDFGTTQSQKNKKDSNGIGVSTTVAGYSAPGEKFGDYTVGFMPIIAPLTYWANKGSNADNYQASITDRTNKTLMRYYESNRALKNNSWVIPASSDNKEVAARLIDYMFSPVGSKIQDFGPESYWDGTITFKGKENPKLKDSVMTMIANRGKGDCFSYWRGYVGSSHGIGHVRSDYVNYLFMNEYGRIGDKHVGDAIGDGVLTLATLANEPSWGSSVPTAGYGAVSDTDQTFDAVTSFWSADKSKSPATGWAGIIKEGTSMTDNTTSVVTGAKSSTAFTYKQVIDQAFSTELTSYLYSILNVDEPDLAQYIPQYVLDLIS